jgi:hypothetical protein
MIFTRLPLNHLIDVENVFDLEGIVLFDLWTSNTDAREVLVFRKADEHTMRARMVDSALCFKGPECGFRDASRVAPLARGKSRNTIPYFAEFWLLL